MLADRAEPVPQQEHQRLLKRARHGDAVGTAGLLVERVDGKQSIGEIGADAYARIRYDHVSHA